MPAILCPSCHQLVSNDATRCPHCGQRQPGLWGFTSAMRKMGLQLDFTRLITLSCVGLYVLSLLVDPGAIFQGGFENPLGLLAPSGQASFMLGMTGSEPVLRYGHWWTLITAMYLHGGLLHIFFNMMWVRQLAPLVEEFFGPFRLLSIFTAGGVAGFIEQGDANLEGGGVVVRVVQGDIHGVRVERVAGPSSEETRPRPVLRRPASPPPRPAPNRPARQSSASS